MRFVSRVRPYASRMMTNNATTATTFRPLRLLWARHAASRTIIRNCRLAAFAADSDGVGMLASPDPAELLLADGAAPPPAVASDADSAAAAAGWLLPPAFGGAELNARVPRHGRCRWATRLAHARRIAEGAWVASVAGAAVVTVRRVCARALGIRAAGRARARTVRIRGPATCCDIVARAAPAARAASGFREADIALAELERGHWSRNWRAGSSVLRGGNERPRSPTSAPPWSWTWPLPAWQRTWHAQQTAPPCPCANASARGDTQHGPRGTALDGWHDALQVPCDAPCAGRIRRGHHDAKRWCDS